jgi:hypothetical protein
MDAPGVAETGSGGGGMARRWWRVARELWLLNIEIRRRTSELAKMDPHVVVVLDDRTRDGCCWVRAAEVLGIPVIALQWAATHRAATMAAIRAARAGSSAERLWTDRWEHFVSSKVAGAVRYVDGRTTWWISPERALAAHWMGAFPRDNPWVFGGGNATQVAVMGEAWRRRSLESGVAADRLVVTGHPQQDAWFQLASRRAACRRRVLHHLGIGAPTELVVLAAPSISVRCSVGPRAGDATPAEIRMDLGSAVDAVAAAAPRSRVVVKVHPRDHASELAFLRRGRPSDPLVVDDLSLDELTAASDALICQWSTSALAGAALGVPVVVFNFRECPSAELWRSTPGLLQADSRDVFQARIFACLSQNGAREKILADQRQVVKQYLYLDGCATRRIAQLIDSCTTPDRSGQPSMPRNGIYKEVSCA